MTVWVTDNIIVEKWAWKLQALLDDGYALTLCGDEPFRTEVLEAMLALHKARHDWLAEEENGNQS